ASAGTCRVVLCLVSQSWLASNECFNEFRAAWYMGNRTIPLFMLSPEAQLDDESRRRLLEVWQKIRASICDPASTPPAALTSRQSARSRTGCQSVRAVGAISRVGLDPEAFAIDRARRPTPFPGLISFGDDDAALFYGRSREIADTLEE